MARIKEIPDSIGGTSFQIAAACSPNMLMFSILERDIKLNNIKIDMKVSGFSNSDLTIQMTKKGAYPFVIDGKEEVE